MTQETNRELLELAAKAAGLNVKGEWVDDDDKFTHLNIGKKFTNERMKWNPLTDDGDGASPEAALGVNLMWWLSSVDAYHEDVGYFTKRYATNGGDKQAARRMATLRVAAAIGKALP